MKREQGTLVVRAFWPEDGVRMGPGRVTALKAELERAAAFGGCGAINYDAAWIR